MQAQRASDSVATCAAWLVLRVRVYSCTGALCFVVPSLAVQVLTARVTEIDLQNTLRNIFWIQPDTGYLRFQQLTLVRRTRVRASIVPHRLLCAKICAVSPCLHQSIAGAPVLPPPWLAYLDVYVCVLCCTADQPALRLTSLLPSQSVGSNDVACGVGQVSTGHGTVSTRSQPCVLIQLLGACGSVP